jgi:hypothetical protein
MFIPLIQTLFICLSAIFVFHLIIKSLHNLFSQYIEAYKIVHTPPQPIIQQVPPELLNEIADIKSKLTGVEFSRGMRKL